ncbi:ABC transporter ATP-binding protein [Ruminococcus sp. FC2018]|uniref:ABC transporter ATP-binding protein n=1 Tax=Ruminococcus sp. FC2018 TaxID=1410617 RepID=UPI000490DF4E|nr:ABC transporter ATP-binding protein [Ruminococcus sp. FC2018]
MNVLEIKDLHKSFGSKTVLDGLTFSVSEGSVFGFIGRNGAGKTTTMKIILGLLQADSGEVTVCGEKVTYGSTAANRFIGYLPDVPEFYGYMTAREYLKLCGEVTGMKQSEIKSRSAELLELVGLAGEKHRIKGYSRGMKQRLGIAQALINKPRLLICDEPTSALDPVGRKEILEIIRSAKGETSVIFSTHILSDVEKICDDTAILEKGRTALCGTVSELKAKRSGSDVQIVPANAGDTEKAAKLLGGEAQSGTVIVRNASQEKMLSILKIISENRIAVQKIEHTEPDLEQLFMEVIGK